MADRRRCFRCGYSLKGLPAAHRCPECGLPYYAWTAVIEEGSSDVYLGGCFALFALATAAGMFVTGKRDLTVVSFILFAVTLLYGTWRWRRGRRNRAGICDEGVFLYRWKNADGELIPWDRIGCAIIGRGHSVTLKDPDGNERHELPLEFFGSRGRSRKFVLAVHDRLRRRGPLPAWVTTDLPGLGPK